MRNKRRVGIKVEAAVVPTVPAMVPDTTSESEEDQLPTEEEKKKQSGNLAFLPPLEAIGEKFAKAIKAFCKEFSPTFPELQRLLSKKMGAVEYGKIQKKLVGDHKMVVPGWDEPPNRIYQLAVKDLVDHIRVQFP